MDQQQLDEINRKRRERGKRELSMNDARSRLASEPRSNDPGFDTTGFLIGYATGFPFGFTTGAIVGAALHPTADYSSPSSSGDGGSANYDSGSSSSSSSSSYDSGSSSSYDSGSSSGGGSFE